MLAKELSCASKGSSVDYRICSLSKLDSTKMQILIPELQVRIDAKPFILPRMTDYNGGDI